MQHPGLDRACKEVLKGRTKHTDNDMEVFIVSLLLRGILPVFGHEGVWDGEKFPKSQLVREHLGAFIPLEATALFFRELKTPWVMARCNCSLGERSLAFIEEPSEQKAMLDSTSAIPIIQTREETDKEGLLSMNNARATVKSVKYIEMSEYWKMDRCLDAVESFYNIKLTQVRRQSILADSVFMVIVDPAWGRSGGIINPLYRYIKIKEEEQ